MSKGENLELLWYRKALWILLAHENPIEIACRAKETQHGPYVNESAQVEQENESYERITKRKI